MEEPTNPTEIKISVFPKKLDVYKRIRETIDETGLSRAEKIALRNAWRKLRPYLNQTSMQVYLDVFTANEMLFECFRKDNKLDVLEASRHPKLVIMIIQTLLDNLENPRIMGVIIKKLVVKHKSRGVLREHWKIYLDVLCQTMLTILRAIASPTLVEALRKLTEYIDSSFEELANEDS